MTLYFEYFLIIWTSSSVQARYVSSVLVFFFGGMFDSTLNTLLLFTSHWTQHFSLIIFNSNWSRLHSKNMILYHNKCEQMKMKNWLDLGTPVNFCGLIWIRRSWRIRKSLQKYERSINEQLGVFQNMKQQKLGQLKT